MTILPMPTWANPPAPAAAIRRETPDYNVTDIVETTPDSSTVMLNGTTPVKINLGGVYNIYNASALGRIGESGH